MSVAPSTESDARAKRNVYAEAADSSRYRVADVPLLSCAAHERACVLCVTAGKNGRNGRTAAAGATLFWLTCPHMNALIARFEAHRCVQAVAEAMRRHAPLRDWHVKSHRAYLDRAKALLTPSQWDFFEAHFQSTVKPSQMKYGNAAVSHAEDMKCLHALVAQTMAGAPNPVGSIVVNYILFQHQLCSAPPTLTEALSRDVNVSHVALRATLDNTQLFENFIDAFVWAATATSPDHEDWLHVQRLHLVVELPEGNPWNSKSTAFRWCGDLDAATLHPDLCALALATLVALEGKPPRPRKKHRIN